MVRRVFTAVAVLAFLVMEPVTYLTHRFVMHGLAERIHRSHHVPSPGRWEANDAFPVVFSAAAMVATLAAYQGWTSRLVLAAVVGVSVYGAARTRWSTTCTSTAAGRPHRRPDV